MKQEPLVSICCITYNHSNYIKDAIEGFLMQKTDFPVEIIIHDDASTDGTAEIVRDYAEKHPEQIFPIFQKENQFSKGQGSISARFVWPRARGKYIAICEGDDYWTDASKLQKQIDALKKHPECKICFHSALLISNSENVKNQVMAKYEDSIKIFTESEVILGKGEFIPTPSIIVEKTVIDILPEWFIKAPIGDYYLQILGSLNGGALYLNDTMAVYRYNLSGSWTARVKNVEFRRDFYLRQLKTFDIAKSYVKIYDKEFDTVKRNLILDVLRDRLIDSETRSKIFNENKENLKFGDKLLWRLIYQNARIYSSLSVLKRIINYPVAAMNGLHKNNKNG